MTTAIQQQALTIDPSAPDWKLKPSLPTRPLHHYCSVMERYDIEQSMHSRLVAIHEAGIKLDGKRNQAKLCQVIAPGLGRWAQGGRQPAEVSADQLVYVKERTIAFRLHLQKQNHFFVAMDAIMAELDPVALRLRPVGQFLVTRENPERERRAVMGELPFHVGHTFGVDKKGSEADDIGCNTRRIEEVVAVGPGKFGGYRPQLVSDSSTPLGARIDMVPYWETMDCRPGDLICFTDMARPTTIHLAGQVYSVFEFDHSVCLVLDGSEEEAAPTQPGR